MSIKSWAVAVLELELGVYVHVAHPFARAETQSEVSRLVPTKSERGRVYRRGSFDVGFYKYTIFVFYSIRLPSRINDISQREYI
jgi:hypothetical protein